MIRGNTLLALVVILGLSCVFCKGTDTENSQESKSLLPDIESDVADIPEEEEQEDENVNDPGWRNRYRYRWRFRKQRYRQRYRRPTQKPYPTQKPPTTGQACSTSRPSIPADQKWANEWKGHFLFQCNKGDSLIYLRSVFRDCQHDRIWVFGCGYNEASKEHCHWTHGYVNDEKQGIFFNCPNHGFITGIESTYTSAGDRRFKFKCCNDEYFDHADCHQSRHLARETFEFKTDRDRRFYITGINSYFNHAKRDRVWKIDYCRSVPEQEGSAEGYVRDPEEKDAITN